RLQILWPEKSLRFRWQLYAKLWRSESELKHHRQLSTCLRENFNKSLGVAKLKNKILIAGCGSIAKTHAKNLHGKADLLFWSRSPEKSKAYAAEYSGR